MDKNIEIRTRRLIIRPFSQDYLEEYYRQFTPEITRYQYPESFPDLRAATGWCPALWKRWRREICWSWLSSPLTENLLAV